MTTAATSTGFIRLKEIIAKLRDPNGGCPWDLKQTHQSLRNYLIEESYEVLDAIDHSPEDLPEELGDVLLQIMLHSQVASDEGRFNVETVIEKITTKMIARHPHVFGTTEVKDADEVLRNWEKIKASEKPAEEGILSGVPRAMPALLRAQRIGEKVARVGFDWPNVDEVKLKVAEELREFLAADQADDPAHTAEEFGDLLFSLVQLGRLMKLDVETVANQANDKFTRRFTELERKAGRKIDSESFSREELERLWEAVKRDERG
jgi:tetrapyrrole methylase family protein/MazG family protein